MKVKQVLGFIGQTFPFGDCSVESSGDVGPYAFPSSVGHCNSAMICVDADIAGLESMNY